MNRRGARRRSFTPAALLVAAGVLTAVLVGAAVQPGLAVTVPTITVTASGATEAGRPIFANSNLSGDNPTGAITFTLYGPGDTTCSTAISTFVVAVTGNGSYNSPTVTATTAGTYRWQAAYGGDVNNAPVVTACNDPAGAVVVTRADTVLNNAASGPAPVGGEIRDTATLLGGENPTGTITFFLYGPTDQFCSLAPLTTSTATVSGNGPYQSAPFTPSIPGVYKWRSTYSGDADNQGVSITGCLDPNAASTVTPVGPTLVTTASPGVAVGGRLTDTAVLAGATDPTGTITFRLYGPDDATCTGTVRSLSTRTVAGNGTYTSDEFTTTAAGTYRWVASYSGDTVNPALANACGEPSETVIVTAVSPPTTATTTPGSTTTTSSSTSTTSSSTTSTTQGPNSTTSSSTSTTTAPSTSTSSTTTTVQTSTSTSTSTTTTTAPGSTTSSTTTTAPASNTSTSTTVATNPTSSTSTTAASTPTSTSSTPTSSTSSTSTTTTTLPMVPVGTGTTVAATTRSLTVSPNPVATGQDATVAGTGFPAGPAAVTLFSTPVELARLTVGPTGAFAIVVTIPADTPPGPHRLVVTGATGIVLAETLVTVTAPGMVPAAAGGSGARILSRTGGDTTGPGSVAVGLVLLGAVIVGLSRRRPLEVAEGPDRYRRRRHPWD